MVDRNLLKQDLPKINDLRLHIRKVCFSYVVCVTNIYEYFVGNRRQVGLWGQKSPTRYLIGVQQLDAVMLEDRCL